MKEAREEKEQVQGLEIDGRDQARGAGRGSSKRAQRTAQNCKTGENSHFSSLGPIKVWFSFSV